CRRCRGQPEIRALKILTFVPLLASIGLWASAFSGLGAYSCYICSTPRLPLFHSSLRSALHPAGTASAAPEPSRSSIVILHLWLLPSVSRGHLELRSIPGAELACISRGDRGRSSPACGNSAAPAPRA